MKDNQVLIEKKLRNITKHRHYIFCAYARNSLFLLLKALNIGQDDEIIMPGFICQSIIEVIIETGARPVLVDTESNSVNISPHKIIHAITRKTKMIYVIHAFGISAEIELISTIAKDYSIFLLEDLSHTLNGTFNGKKLGTFGDFVIFSFTKTMINYQGGAVATNDENLYIKMRELQVSLVSVISKRGNHIFYYFYRLLCSIWECRGSAIALPFFKVLFLIKGKKHIDNLYMINKDFFNISKLSLLVINIQLSMQLSNKYIQRRNNKYLKTIRKGGNKVKYLTMLKEQTGLMPNYLCGTIIKNSKLKRFFSLEIWSNTNVDNNLINSKSNYNKLRIFAKRLW